MNHYAPAAQIGSPVPSDITSLGGGSGVRNASSRCYLRDSLL